MVKIQYWHAGARPLYWFQNMLWAVSWCLLVAICTFYGNLDQVVVHPDRLWRQAFNSIHRDWSANTTHYYSSFVL